MISEYGKSLNVVLLILLGVLCYLSASSSYAGFWNLQSMPNQPSTGIEAAQGQTPIIIATRYIDAGKLQDAAAILAHAENLSAAELMAKRILLAKIALLSNQPRAAIDKITGIQEVTNLPEYFQIQYYELLASAYSRLDKTVYALQARIKLDRLLQEPKSQDMNRRKIWLVLMKLPAPELNTLLLERERDQLLQGWVKLALIAKQKVDNQTLYAQLQNWQQMYPQHPANRLLPSPLSAAVPYLHPLPKQIALLLPLSGPLAGPGQAIQDGFLAAYQSDDQKDRITIKTYDTTAGDIRELYQRAINEGADYVVGPLMKQEVAVIAGLQHPVPTLLLNDMNIRSQDFNAYHFGLSPMNEARQTAVKAASSGLRRALIIAPEGVWGNDITAAFTDEWYKNGGVVVDKLIYGDNMPLDRAIRDLLRVSAHHLTPPKSSRSRAVADQEKPESKRRQDFDMIFLLAYPSKARQIMPLLKYYFAGGAPVYSISTIYAGDINTMRDRDLDGIIFCDMPWIFKHPGTSKNWREQLNSYNRLYALGLDSFALAMRLNALVLFPAMLANEDAGVLYLNRAGQVARVLSWGRFENGMAHLIN